MLAAYKYLSEWSSCPKASASTLMDRIISSAHIQVDDTREYISALPYVGDDQRSLPDCHW
jgi:hypothetical protein